MDDGRSVLSGDYIGRLAPSPTGYLHLGHARTFLRAAERARAAGGQLILRMDDLDTARCRPEYAVAAREDLAWLGLPWEQPEQVQSQRLERYRKALSRLHTAGAIYPCHRSRKDLAAALSAPHEGAGGAVDDEPLYPPDWRPHPDTPLPALDSAGWATNWRFRVPDGRRIVFEDAAQGSQTAEAGREFGDFLVWRKDGLPSYQLACVVDDAELGITEVVRGADLIRSTFRQLLLWERLVSGDVPAPGYYHVPLLNDAQGQRLAKRHDALALRTLRARGLSPAQVRAMAGV